MLRFGLKKLNNAEVKEQYQVKISNRLVALANLDDNVDINRASENFRDNINISAKDSLGHYELKQRLKLLDKRKEAKLQWLQNPSQINRDNTVCTM
jgi:hypothetical protein